MILSHLAIGKPELLFLVAIFLIALTITIVFRKSKYRASLWLTTAAILVAELVLVGYMQDKYDRSRYNNYSNSNNNINQNDGKPDVVALLNERVSKESHGALQVVDFEVQSSNPVHFGGVEMYSYNGNMILEAERDLYKRGNRMEGYWQGYYCYDKPEDESMGGFKSIYDYKYFAKGSRIRLERKVAFKKTDQGWQLPQ